MSIIQKMEKLINNKIKLLKIADKKTNEILTRNVNGTGGT